MTGNEAGWTEAVKRLGRIALVTQGVLYVIVGILAVQVATGDQDAQPSQRGAIAAVSRQHLGRLLLVVLAAGLVVHAAWRLLLAIRGEPGHDDEDGGSLAKRAANLGRAAIYASFTVAAVEILVHVEGSGGGERRGTAMVLRWPGGPELVMVAGGAVIGAGLWNARKAITRSFVDKLDLHRLDEPSRRAIVAVGVAGYLARGMVFGLVGWFLVQAGIHEDANETRGLDGALREVAQSSHGDLLLGILAVGLVLFGAFRIVDGLYRVPTEVAYA